MEFSEVMKAVPSNFADGSRVWIYQAGRPFSDRETVEINDQLHHFYAQWHSHGAPVKGWASVLFNRYVVIMADETEVPLGGCSMDASMRVIKSLENQYQTKLFDRLSITFFVKGKIEMLPMGQVQYALDKGYITMDTPMFNNLVATKKDLLENWLKPLRNTWLGARVHAPVAAE